MMNIEIWSDYSCPFCYIGKRKLENAIKELGVENKIKLVFKAYQLNPDAPEVAIDGIEGLSKIKGIPKEQVKVMYGQATTYAKMVGLDYHMDKIQYVSTYKAHRLAKLAKKYGKESELTELLMDGYFVKGLNLGDHDTLTKLATSVGLDEELVKSILNTNEFANLVDKDIEEAESIGIQGVPFFIFGRKYAVSGAQDTAIFKQAITKALEETKSFTLLDEEDAPKCEGDECSI
ncbi:DsbA family oxidoreductase [Acholeplasma hippikon]|nr:DsbA family oxidoreductase [Acholeplasma hippikon]